MSLCLNVASQIAFLFAFIAIGYFFAKKHLVPEGTAAVLSKLENLLFIPALVAGTFIENFTVERISSMKTLVILSSITAIIAAVFAVFASRLLTKDKYIRNIYTYGLAFSNFGFMGNAVVMSVFPEMFFEYLIFTLPLWILIYLWGVPRLLMADAEKKPSFKESLKCFINPMFVAMLLGMAVGLLGIKLPEWLLKLVDVSGDCMSPVAMLLTGVVVSGISLKKTFTNIGIYAVSIIRLLAMPLLFVLVARWLSLSEIEYACTLCSLAMPLGLNTIVIPSALGKDTEVAAGMAVVSHFLSLFTIPALFLFLQL